MKKLLFVIMITSVLVACGGDDAEKKQEVVKEEIKKKNVTTDELKVEDVFSRISTNSELAPLKQKIYSVPGGDVVEVYVKNGERVIKNKKLANIKSTEINTGYYASKAAYREAKANYNRSKQLYNEKLISEMDFLRIKTAYEQSRSAYKIAAENLEDLNPKADFNGVVAGITIKKYDKLQENQNIITLIDDSVMEFTVGITGKDLRDIKVGNKVDVLVEELDKTFEGKITEIDPVSAAETKKYPVKIQINNTQRELNKGMYVKASIYGKISKGFVVPKEAIVLKNLHRYLFIVRDGVAKRIEVVLGTDLGDKQEIISKDLKAGDKFVIKGQFFLKNNEPVVEVK